MTSVMDNVSQVFRVHPDLPEDDGPSRCFPRISTRGESGFSVVPVTPSATASPPSRAWGRPVVQGHSGGAAGQLRRFRSMEDFVGRMASKGGEPADSGEFYQGRGHGLPARHPGGQKMAVAPILLESKAKEKKKRPFEGQMSPLWTSPPRRSGRITRSPSRMWGEYAKEEILAFEKEVLASTSAAIP